MSDELVDMFSEAMSDDTGEGIEPVAVEDDAAEETPVDTPEDEAVAGEDEGITDEDVEGEDDPKVDDTAEEAPVEEEDVEEPETFDWEASADQLVTVKVQGEDVTMPLREAMGGHMRQQDYSRKTAEIAEQRDAAQWALDVQGAFEKDAQGTLKAFAEAYGVETAREIEQAVQQPTVDPYAEMDPDTADIMRAMDSKLAAVTSGYEEKIGRLESQAGQINRERLVKDAETEMTALTAQFEEAGYDLDKVAVLETATSRNITLTDAAAIWAGQNLLTDGKNSSEADAKAAKAAKARVAKTDGKRKAAKKKASSTSDSSFDVSDTQYEDFDTISDLLEQQLNSG